MLTKHHSGNHENIDHFLKQKRGDQKWKSVIHIVKGTYFHLKPHKGFA